MLFVKAENPSDGISINNVKKCLESRGFTIVVIPSQLGIHPDSYYSYNKIVL